MTTKGISLFEELKTALERDRFPEAQNILPVTRATVEKLAEELETIVRRRKVSVNAYIGFPLLEEAVPRVPRLRAIAETGTTCYVFGHSGGEFPAGGGIRAVELLDSDLVGERFVVLQGPEFSGALVAKADGPEASEPSRQEYRCLLTLDRKVVTLAVAELNKVLVHRHAELLPPPKASVSFASDVARAAAGTLLLSQLASQIDSLERRLHETSVLDAHTGLHNQRFFYMQLIREVNRFQRQERPFSIIFLDIQESNPQPEEPIYRASPEAIKALAKFLQERVRRGVDMAFRLRGNEFAAILIDTRERQAAAVAVRLEDCFNKLGFAGLSLKIGVSEFSSGDTIESILTYAKRRLKRD